MTPELISQHRRVIGRATAVGVSNSPDAAVAGRAAASAARSPLVTDGHEPRLFVVFASISYDLERLLGAIGEVAEGVPVIGCTTAGEISTSGPSATAVVVFALGGDGFSITTGIGEIVDGDLRRVASTASRCIDAVDRRANTVLMLLSDGLSGDQQEVVRGAYEQVGAAIPLVGGCAGDDLFMTGTHQFFGDRVVRNSVVAAAISSDGPLGIGVSHGWRPVGEPMTVTSSDGVVVQMLDDRPALDVYLDRLGAPDHVRTDPAAFTVYAATRPIGLVRRGRDEIRFVATADFEQRSITCFAAVPKGARCSIMQGDAASVLAATDTACRDAFRPLNGAPPRGVLVFDCIARKGVLAGGIVTEIGRIGELAEGAPVAGFFTYGEIARITGSSGFHNQTLVVLALG